MLAKVKEKLEKEMQQKISGRHASAVRPAVYAQLLDFCEKNEEFAQAVLDSEKTLNDCCEAIMAGCGSCISDFEVYGKMAQFYFPGSSVEAQLRINLSADAERNPLGVQDKKAVVLDLFDLF